MDSHLGYSVYVIMLQVVDICGLFLDTWEGVVTVIFTCRWHHLFF